MTITGKTKILGIIGCPIEHSLSPSMQNAALQAAGLDYIYIPFHVQPQNLAAAVNGLRHLGIRGFNVTIPHKTAILPLLDTIEGDAEIIGAVNTVKREGDRLVGYNTDAPGFLSAIKDDLGFTPDGKTVFILGAGGAARGAVAALCRAGAKRIVIANRTREKADELVSFFSSHFPEVLLAACSLEESETYVGIAAADLVVNTTSVGMSGTSFATLNLSVTRENAVVYDMVYSPPETPFLATARKTGRKAANGLGMLAAQGEAAFEIWTGQKAPAGLMREQLLSLTESAGR